MKPLVTQRHEEALSGQQELSLSLSNDFCLFWHGLRSVSGVQPNQLKWKPQTVFQAMLTRLCSHRCDSGNLLVKNNIQSPDVFTRLTENNFKRL
jgi:hypothetical protein